MVRWTSLMLRAPKLWTDFLFRDRENSFDRLKLYDTDTVTHSAVMMCHTTSVSH